MNIKSVCVYCASSSKIDQIYFDAATRLGSLLAKSDIACVCGAGHQGLMKELADSVLNSGGNVTGIIPRFMYEEGWFHKSLTKLIVTGTIHERKERMAQASDAIVALPGGCGTMEELLEIITWKQLGLFKGSIVILNINGYYSPLIEMLEKAVEQSFMHEAHASIWAVANTAEEALMHVLSAENWIENPRHFAVV
jgi:uncharacterized protein (TIGR00730 family)